MKFLIDADCPRSIASPIKKSGHEVLDIRDIKPNAPDQEIYELIKKDGYILITRDTDFGNILRYPVTSKCGIILLRMHLLPIAEITKVLADFIAKVNEKELLGCLSVIRKDRYRMLRM